MSDLQQELETVRREVAELRAAVQSIETRQGSNKEEAWDSMSRRMALDMEKQNRPAAIGVQRNVVFKRRQYPNDDSVYGSEHHFGEISKLPSEQQLIQLGEALSGPLGMRALYMLIRRYFEGHDMHLRKAELAAALGVSEVELEQGLRLLVARDTLRVYKDENGQEHYRLERADVAAILLTLV